MCGGCRVKLGDQVKFACVDGPDFDAHKVDFGDLMMRLRRYADEEKAALHRWSENCRMKDVVPTQVPPDLMREMLELPDAYDEVPGG
jgi:hypothetical protein